MELLSSLQKGVFYKTFIAAGSAVKLPENPRRYLGCHPDTWAELSQEDKDMFEVRDADKISMEL